MTDFFFYYFVDQFNGQNDDTTFSRMLNAGQLWHYSNDDEMRSDNEADNEADDKADESMTNMMTKLTKKR
jgi:hypothetical protein